MNESGYFEISADGPEGETGEPRRSRARLAWQGGKATITDLGGAGSLTINGAPIKPDEPTILETGDTISFAGVQMKWQRAGQTEPAFDDAARRERHLLIVDAPGWRREIVLRDEPFTLGRAESNDVIINNEGVSRQHARLEPRSGGFEIIDQNSTFGLKVEGQPVTRKLLVTGDVIQMADDVLLTYKVEGGEAGARVSISAVGDGQPMPLAGQTSRIDMAQQLAGATDALPQSTGLWQSGVPHLVIRLMGKTWQALFNKDHMTIGRGDENDIVIPDTSISRRHATIDRNGEAFILRDAGSDNGVWVGKQRVEKHSLRPGEVISMGRAKLFFKGGFNLDDLTLIGTPKIDGKRTRRPVIFVPGLGGSELWLGSERVYPVPRVLLSRPEILSLPGDPRMEARRIVSDVVIVPGIFKQEQYSRLGDYLEAGLGYTRGKDLLEFAYDWRQDIRLAAQKLAQTIDEWRPGAPVTIVAHSLGTLVTRYYVEKLGGKRQTERIILMGGPQYGTPKALLVILFGPGILPFGIGDERIRRVMAQYPSSYQILPVYPSVFDQHGRQIDVLQDPTWLPEEQRPYLKYARDFRKELGFRSSVPCVSIFGYGFKTTTRVQIERRPDGGWHQVSAVDEIAGDLSVPAGSAVLKNSEFHPVLQEHGALYIDNDVKMRLKVELTRSTTLDGKRV